MLVKAMDNFQVAKRKHNEQVKAQHLAHMGSKGEKTFFRASELGQGDRKILYSFFQHQLPVQSRTAHNLRQLENGDYVHDRYQTAWQDMGVLISMEERLSSKDDEYLGQFDWEWAGHYDGLLDINILRAHNLGLVTIHSVLNEETGEYEIEIEVDDEYADSIGLFDEEGYLSEDYQPLPMLADIKTMNPWGFKRVKEQKDLSSIQGYIDQAMFYMYMLNTPYGSIFIENKANNDVVDVQLVWKDLHEDVIYEFDEEIHGKVDENILQITVDSVRFFGSDTHEGSIQRIERLNEIKNRLMEADKTNDEETIVKIFSEEIPKCTTDNGEEATPDRFPCSWGTGQCEFYDHCWNPHHNGMAVRPFEILPEENKWVVTTNDGDLVVDNRKVPEGIEFEAFEELVNIGAINIKLFLADEDKTTKIVDIEKAKKTAIDGDNLFDATGELKIIDVAMEGKRPSEAKEYENDEGERAIDCLNCGRQNVFKRLGPGGTKKCEHCNHRNVVES